MRIIFIGGARRSGGTLVEQGLAELPGVCGLGEVTKIWQHALREDVSCGCGAAFTTCEFWTAIGEEAFGGWRNVDLRRVATLRHDVARTRHVPRLVNPRFPGNRVALARECAEYFARIYTAAAAVSGAEVIIDSSKNAGLAFCLRAASALDLRIVHLVRDPRSVAYTRTRPTTNHAREHASVAPVPASRTVWEWTAQNAAFDLLARLSERHRGQHAYGRVPITRIRYEDFVENPRGALSAIAALAEINVDPTSFSHPNDGHANLGGVHNAGGHPVRFTTGQIPLRHDDDWRTALPRQQRRIVSLLSAPLRRRYGYR